MRCLLLIPALFLTLFINGAVGSLQAAEVAKTAAPKIGVLRLEEVLRQSKTYLAGMDAWKKTQAEAQATITAIDEQLKRLEGQLQVINQQSENYAKFQEELETLKLKKKLGFERARADLERRQVALVKGSYQQMHTALATFCQERGIMLVHLAPDPQLGAPSFNEIQLELGLKSVLYFEPSLDITESFVQYLNSESAGKTDKPTPDAKPDAKPADKPVTP
jgi:Skp family chaperone for outer membrane proteins